MRHTHRKQSSLMCSHHGWREKNFLFSLWPSLTYLEDRVSKPQIEAHTFIHGTMRASFFTFQLSSAHPHLPYPPIETFAIAGPPTSSRLRKCTCRLSSRFRKCTCRLSFRFQSIKTFQSSYPGWIKNCRWLCRGEWGGSLLFIAEGIYTFSGVIIVNLQLSMQMCTLGG